jgi:hypothetical protein
MAPHTDGLPWSQWAAHRLCGLRREGRVLEKRTGTSGKRNLRPLQRALQVPKEQRPAVERLLDHVHEAQGLLIACAPRRRRTTEIDRSNSFAS